MIAGKPSSTAERVALRRAAHQIFDDPIIFPDPLALRILGLTERHVRSGELRAPQRASSQSLRAFLVARSVFAEQLLQQAVHRGCTQYVLLGAGLDTFACRNSNPALHVFEVDHPATQAWKRESLCRNGIAVPSTCSFVPVDFEHDRLLEQLALGGFQPDRPAVFAWMGVLPYLTEPAMRATLAQLQALPAATDLLLDYGLPRDRLSAEEQLRFDSLSARVARAGEPLRLFFTPEGMAAELAQCGFQVVQDWDSDSINRRYFHERKDGLRMLGSATHLLHARKVPSVR